MSRKSISGTKWKNGADSPVLFFIDDLSNRWLDKNEDGLIQTEEDYGFLGFNPDGVISFLESEILSSNLLVKTTFFAVTGAMTPISFGLEDINHSFPMNFSKESCKFFRALHNDDRFEIAYHGTNHGLESKRSEEFIQEWDSFKSLEEALRITEKGRSIFRDTVDEFPKGGKYCGYRSNSFSDESIDTSGFTWWCRHYNRAAVNGSEDAQYGGSDRDPISAFNYKVFGENGVIDIPTTIPGSSLNSVFTSRRGLRGALRKLLKPVLLRWKLRKIKYLLKNNLIISIQEHISPTRGDGRRQTPNIFDDIDSLKAIFKYLKNKNVWYCTGSELADWINEEASCR